MLAGAGSSLFWMLFVHEKASTALLLCNKLFHVRSLGIRLVDGAETFVRSGPVIWSFVDPMIIGFPVAVLATVLVSLVTKKLPEDHLESCFGRRTVVR